MRLHNARLEEYARTLGGRREYRGDINAQIVCNGLGSDLRTLQGSGEAHITDGDLGELPAYFRPVALVNRTINPDVPRVQIKTAFDSVDLAFTISHGLWNLDPIKFTGNAISLQGRGTLDPQSNVDLRLEPLLGRDRFHLPIVSDLSLAASAPLLRVRVTGTLSHPDFSVEPLPLLQRDPVRSTAGRRGSPGRSDLQARPRCPSDRSSRRMAGVTRSRAVGFSGARPMAVSTIPSTQPAGPIEPPGNGAIPPLENGDRLTRDEFERRYDAMPNLKKAELIEGEVYHAVTGPAAIPRQTALPPQLLADPLRGQYAWRRGGRQ